MRKTAFSKIRADAVCCIIALLFTLSFVIMAYGQVDCIEGVRVAQKHVNITSKGVGHPVVLHTELEYDLVDLDSLRVFINVVDSEDCDILVFTKHQDDNGYLDIHFLVLDLQDLDREGCSIIPDRDEPNTVFIKGADNLSEFCIWGDLNIIERQGQGPKDK